MKHDEPEATYSPLGVKLFGKYAQRYFLRHFTALRISLSGTVPAIGPNTILYANHPSWWDPIVMLLFACGPLADRRVFAPIDAGSLQRYPILRRLGLYPVDRDNTASVRRFLATSNRLLENPHNVLALTAQGRFTDQRQRPAGLRDGIAHLLRADPLRRAIPIAIEYTYWDGRLPEALVRFGDASSARPDATIDETRQQLDEALTSSLDALQSESLQRDPKLFATLVGQRATDVGGIYGAIRHAANVVSRIGRAPSPAPRTIEPRC